MSVINNSSSQSRSLGTIACPVCKEQIPLQPKEGNPRRVVAKHACGGQPYRTVLEKDAPDFPPLALLDRIEQTEYQGDQTPAYPIKKKKR